MFTFLAKVGKVCSLLHYSLKLFIFCLKFVQQLKVCCYGKLKRVESTKTI